MLGPHVGLKCSRCTPAWPITKGVNRALHAYMCMYITTAIATAAGSVRTRIGKVYELYELVPYTPIRITYMGAWTQPS